MNTIYDVCIIGSGPAAHTAAIYTSRANLSTILFEGDTPGGQLTKTTEVENFPGFPESIFGFDLCEKFKEQSQKYGTIVISEIVEKIDTQNKPFCIFTNDGMYFSNSIIIATGSSAKTLNFENSDKFWSRGISACAVCDGALPCYRNKPIAVVGGGDTAMEEALFLSKYASKVYIIHRRDSFRASKIMQDRVFTNDKISIIWNSEIEKADGKESLESITLKNNKDNSTTILEISGLFYGIGHSPATSFLDGQISLDKDGYILTNPESTETNIEGIFACGDVRDKKWRQAITAAGSGCMAALECIHFLENLV